MHYLKSVVVILIVLLSFSCSTDQSAEDKQATGQKPTSATSKDTAQKKSYSYLTEGIWNYRYAVKVRQDFDPSSIQGEWLDLKTDYTYLKGKYDDTTEQGRYKYNHDQKKIQFHPTDAEYPTSEWTLNYRLGTLIFAGTPTYGNNDTQVKAVRQHYKPTREE